MPVTLYGYGSAPCKVWSTEDLSSRFGSIPASETWFGQCVWSYFPSAICVVDDLPEGLPLLDGELPAVELSDGTAEELEVSSFRLCSVEL